MEGLKGGPSEEVKVQEFKIITGKVRGRGWESCGLHEMKIGGMGLSRCDVNMSTAEAKKSDRDCDCVPDDKVSLTHSERKSSSLQCLSASQRAFLRCETAGVTTDDQCCWCWSRLEGIHGQK